jgi:transcriptional regulator with XRE-family HTH domain
LSTISYKNSLNGAIGRRLAQIRLKQDQNQLEFAQALGISSGALKNYERGHTEPPVSLVRLLHERYDTNPTWFLLGLQSQTYGGIAEAVEECESVAEVAIRQIDPKANLQNKAKLLRVIFSMAMENEGQVDKDKILKMLEFANYAKSK